MFRNVRAPYCELLPGLTVRGIQVATSAAEPGDVSEFVFHVTLLHLTILPVNTKLTYLYRDGSNYKQWNEVIVSGTLDRATLACCLWEGDFFIPQAVGLPALQDRFAAQGYDFPNEDDHLWHEIDAVETTNDPPTIDRSAAEIMKRFKDASDRGWEKWLADLIAGRI